MCLYISHLVEDNGYIFCKKKKKKDLKGISLYTKTWRICFDIPEWNFLHKVQKVLWLATSVYLLRIIFMSQILTNHILFVELISKSMATLPVLYICCWHDVYIKIVQQYLCANNVVHWPVGITRICCHAYLE